MRRFHLPLAQPCLLADLQHPRGSGALRQRPLFPVVLRLPGRAGVSSHRFRGTGLGRAGPCQQRSASLFLPPVLAHRIRTRKDERPDESAVAGHLGSRLDSFPDPVQPGGIGVDAIQPMDRGRDLRRLAGMGCRTLVDRPGSFGLGQVEDRRGRAHPGGLLCRRRIRHGHQFHRAHQIRHIDRPGSGDGQHLVADVPQRRSRPTFPSRTPGRLLP